jgi:23S rRNA (pseudouridine1915-N3)-methyltransferase
MKIKIIHIGKLSISYKDSVQYYTDRLSHYCELEIVSVKQAKNMPDDKAVEIEGERLLKAIEGEDCIVALSEEGKTLRSVEFANWLSVARTYAGCVTFVIGGAFGLSNEVKQKADLLLSLSLLTFQHDLAQLVLLEQIYRAMTIMRGESYHK